MKFEITQEFVSGSTLLGVAVSLFGLGFILPSGSWQQMIMFGCGFLYLIFSNIVFWFKKR